MKTTYIKPEVLLVLSAHPLLQTDSTVGKETDEKNNSGGAAKPMSLDFGIDSDAE